MTVISPQPFITGFREFNGEALNKMFGWPQWSVEDGITAAAGGGQTNARPLAAVFNNVTTVATGNDSVRLRSTQFFTTLGNAPTAGNPTSGPGSLQIIFNSASNSLQVFGAGTDTINGVATGTGVAIAGGKMGIFWANVPGNWKAVLALA